MAVETDTNLMLTLRVAHVTRLSSHTTEQATWNYVSYGRTIPKSKAKHHGRLILRLFPPRRGVGLFGKRTEVLPWKRGLLATISNVHVFISENALKTRSQKRK